MNLVKKFIEQGRAFEKAYKIGNWDQLRPYFAKDMVYEVSNISFHCEVRGVDNILAGFERATSGFDKKCKREINVADHVFAEEGNKVLFHSFIRFTRGDAPPIQSGLWEIATYENDQITRLLDIYDPGCAQEFDQWMASWGQGLDPRYRV